MWGFQNIQEQREDHGPRLHQLEIISSLSLYQDPQYLPFSQNKIHNKQTNIILNIFYKKRYELHPQEQIFHNQQENQL